MCVCHPFWKFLFDEVVFFLFFHSCIYKFCLFVAYKYGFADQPPSNERQWFYVGEVVCPEWAMAIVGCRCPESKKPRANLNFLASKLYHVINERSACNFETFSCKTRNTSHKMDDSQSTPRPHLTPPTVRCLKHAVWCGSVQLAFILQGQKGDHRNTK